MRKLNHRKSDATQPLQKKGQVLSELAVHRDRSHSPQGQMASKQILFKDAVIDDDKGAMSQDDAPDKEVGNDSFEFSDGKGVIKFE